tara:strand:+ start:188 stop:1051 length:864 start_codon:yes stop_codon:yes gene_type:complete
VIKENTVDNENWDLVIGPKKAILSVDLKSIWDYRDLLGLFVKRDFVSVYKQTILGPIWFLVQPILTTITFTIIFGNVAKIPTDGMPKILFYMSGITLWTYFADCVNKTSTIFVANQGLFAKVYFPRLIVPISIIVNNLFKLIIQLIMYTIFWLYYFSNGANIMIDSTIYLIPVILLLTGLLGLSFGLIISSLTTKYRDFTFLISFGIQLLMYASPIVYPLSVVPEKYKWIIMLNPISSLIELFKFTTLGSGHIDISYLIYSVTFTLVALTLGILVFNKVEKTFIDTV